MPQIYTKDEVDKLVADIKIDTMNALANLQGQIDAMRGIIETEHNENFSNYRMCINQINDLDQKAKTKKDNGTVSPYAR